MKLTTSLVGMSMVIVSATLPASRPYSIRLRRESNLYIWVLGFVKRSSVCVGMWACMMCACMHACVYACMHACVYVCMHACVYAAPHRLSESGRSKLSTCMHGTISRGRLVREGRAPSLGHGAEASQAAPGCSWALSGVAAVNGAAVKMRRSELVRLQS